MVERRLKECLVLVSTLVFAGFAGGLLINVGIGSDTITVFLDGLSRTLNVSVGIASLIFNVSIICLGFFFAKKDMGWLSVAFCLGIGFSLDFFIPALRQFNLNEKHSVIQILLVMIAQCSFGIAYALLIHFKSGMNPIDSLAYKLADVFKCSFRISRTLMDIILISTGFLMGGVVGIGSLISVSTNGLSVSFVLGLLERGNKKSVPSDITY